jgi:hypothetical protein
MTGNIVGEPIEDFVDSQIKIRQSAQFGGYNTLRTDDQIHYLNNRNAWVKLASSISVLPDANAPLPTNAISTSTTSIFQKPILAALQQSQSTRLIPLGESKLAKIGIKDTSNYLGTKLAEKAVLFNTISQYTSGGTLSNNRAGVTDANNLWNDNFIYGIGGTEFGIQPPPGIIEVSVDSINRGSIRKANITLKAHNKFQFDLIELLYLRLGFTMMLEWGWDNYLDNNGEIQQVRNTIIEDEWFKTNGTTQLQMLNSIQKKRKDYQGNYDGFFGKVSNFTWNFNPDGSYDISIDLITLGDVIESLKVNTSVKEKFYPDGGFFKDIKFGEDVSDTNIAKVATLNTLGYFLFNKMKEISNNFSYERNENINTNYPDYITLITTNTTSYKYQYYVRLGEFLTQLEGLVVPKIQNNNSDKFSQITFEKTGCLISYFPNQIPLDPRVCIFKPSLNSYGDIKGINNPSYFDLIPIPYLVSIEGNLYGSLMDLYINFEFIAGLLAANGGPDQELSLFKFLQGLCDGINDALGGVNKLEPVVKEDYTITIIDQTLSSPEVEAAVSLEVYGYNPSNLDGDGKPAPVSNFVKDVKFISKITPQLASMVSIGATAAGVSTSEIDGTAFSKWSEGLVDRFAEKISEPAAINILKDNQEKGAKSIEEYAEIFQEFEYADDTISSLRSFQYALARWGSNRNPGGLDTVVLQSLEEEEKTKKRIVNDFRYKDLENKAMTFSEFFTAATQIDINKRLQGIRSENEINELASTNYIVYLIKAFGGISDQIKVEYPVGNYGPEGTGLLTGILLRIFNAPTSLTLQNLKVDPNQSRYQEFDDTFISQGKSSYKIYINTLNNNRYKTDNIPSSEIGFIPLSFELVLDGISGIKIYNKLKINNKFLPSNYPESLKFIITKVNHNISNNNWDTSLSTISIPKTEPYLSQLPTSENTGNTGESGGSGNVSNSITGLLTPQPGQSGLLEPLKSIAAKYESGAKGYGAANTGTTEGCVFFSTTNVENIEFRELRRLMRLPGGTGCNRARVFAAGKYQIIPTTMFGGNKDANENYLYDAGLWKQLGLTDTDKYTAEIQEKMFLQMMLNKTNLGNYVTAKNEGTLLQLSAAVQDLSQLFASMPTIKKADGSIVGNVELGTGNTGYFLDAVNSKPKAISVRQIAKIIVQTRINYKNSVPKEYPSYYTSPF